MKIKVCGMRERENLEALLQLPVDFVGFIFYEKSQRYVAEKIAGLDFSNKEKVGVFVNADLHYILKKTREFEIKTVQLHGLESPEFCKKLKTLDFKIIKAFSVGPDFDFASTKKYESFCDYFLFDTKGKMPGGNGFTFDWNLLEKYEGLVPFFLSGGINFDLGNTVKELKFSKLHGMDLNSGFEIQPAFKDISLLKKFIQNVTT